MIDRPPRTISPEARSPRWSSGCCPSLSSGSLALAGVHVPLTIPVGVAVAGFAWRAPLYRPRPCTARPEARRQSFKHALGAFFNLVGINIAAGKGVEGALETAAEAGDGDAFREIRHALYRAKITGESPWAGLDRLGEDIGVAELRELAAAVGLAGDSAPGCGTSLAAKARPLRHRGLADDRGGCHLGQRTHVPPRRPARPVVHRLHRISRRRSDHDRAVSARPDRERTCPCRHQDPCGAQAVTWLRARSAAGGGR